ncbi:MAG: hypothetical protein COW67_13180 [Flavobacteriales bacterium CG18_big_fil_WC_8_21_14_2_50_32_9]|nr:MAG: hypothetical protein COW67_13180 [Flavobacteriales bacterium CG18_big_fil_WC_8_21_14_2_50_32_9]
MLVFIDESGDSGFKLGRGSSEYFTVALVVFNDLDEANACDSRIQLLKRELGKPEKWEFHFKENSNKIREQFIKAVTKYEFFYYSIVINKKNIYSENLSSNKDSFYKYTCSLVFENAKDKLDNAIVLIDESGNNDFRKSLSNYLKKRMNDYERKVIKKVKMQKSHTNNLLQLADYIAGIINRSVLGKDENEFRKMISEREILVQIWPQHLGNKKS